MNTPPELALVAGLLLGAAGLAFVQWLIGSMAIREARLRAEEIRKTARQEARSIQQEHLLEVKDEIQKNRRSFEREVRRRRRELEALEDRLVERETAADDALTEAEDARESARHDAAEARQNKEESDRLVEAQKSELERISTLTREEATERLFATLEEELRPELEARAQEMERRFRDTALTLARRTVVGALQNCIEEASTDALVTVIKLPKDEMKGRIIGREGRNIRAFEYLSGVDVIVDDTPSVVHLSCFSPLKREVARIAMERLVADGRIHPSKIEAALEQAQRDLLESIQEAGEQAALRAGLTNLPDRIVHELGKLKFKSYRGQTILDHSLEVSQLAGIMAAEVGADAPLARRGGLLHDIGKVCAPEEGGPHSRLGAELARRLGESDAVCEIIARHHDPEPPQDTEAALVHMANRLSAERPGARRGEFTAHVKRLHDIESLARGLPGVKSACVLQAGRELRVQVEPDQVPDGGHSRLAGQIAARLRREVDFSGQIRVVVIREVRTAAIAR